MGVNATGTLGVAGRAPKTRESRRRRRGGWGMGRKFMIFSSKNGVIWCILGVLFYRFMCHENDSDLRYSEVPLKGKNTCQNIGVGRQHRTTPAGQILGGRDPCKSATPAALTHLWLVNSQSVMLYSGTL